MIFLAKWRNLNYYGSAVIKAETRSGAKAMLVNVIKNKGINDNELQIILDRVDGDVIDSVTNFEYESTEIYN